jgi:predicted DNA-binding transcriptional regulator YafY
MRFLDELNLLEQIDSMIRREHTGDAENLAARMGVSSQQVHHLLDVLKELGADIAYHRDKHSFCYENDLKFSFSLVMKPHETQYARGGQVLFW